MPCLLVNIPAVSEEHALSSFSIQQSKMITESIAHCRFHEIFKGLIKTPKINLKRRMTAQI
jgi:hypothetical protein